MNILNLFKKQKFGTGAIDDPRTTAEKSCDYQAEEVATLAPIEWRERPEAEWRKYPIFNQAQSGSCVAQSVSKLLGIENHLEEKKFVHFSARDIYTRRKNTPNAGMWFQDAMRIGHKLGSTIEQLMPSQNLNEPAMNIADDRTPLTEIVAKVGRGGNYLALPHNFDRIASIVEQGKGVMLGFRFTMAEWNRPVPVILGTEQPYHHGVVATNAILHKGQKALVIEDSWGLTSGINGRRIITENWVSRMTSAWYYQYFQNTDQTQLQSIKPRHRFTKPLIFGMWNNDVKMLQDILKFEGLFPANTESTGLYSSITATGVLAFQRKHRVALEAELVSLAGRRVGTQTIKKLNELYGL